MAGLGTLANDFDRLRAGTRSWNKRAFANEIEGYIEDDEELQEILTQHRKSGYLAITFDRIKNDNRFGYREYDWFLKILDVLSGGIGIYKPTNQIRALRWMGNPQQLLQVTERFRRNRQLRYRRAIGVRIDRKIYEW